MASRATRTLSLFVFLMIISFSLSTSSRVFLRSNSDEKVSLGVYCEAMCPFCSYFYVNLLPDLLRDDELFSIVDLHIVPWGSAQIMSNGTWDCEHGPYECFLNTVEACAIDTWPKLGDHYPFIHCVESFVLARNYTQWPSCFKKLGVDAKPIMDCTFNGSGKELELQHAAKTLALHPPLYYVPWIVVDGKPLKDYQNFISYICKAYKGTKVPKACTQLSGYDTKMGNVNSPVCFRDSAISILSEGRDA